MSRDIFQDIPGLNAENCIGDRKSYSKYARPCPILLGPLSLHFCFEWHSILSMSDMLERDTHRWGWGEIIKIATLGFALLHRQLMLPFSITSQIPIMFLCHYRFVAQQCSHVPYQPQKSFSHHDNWKVTAVTWMNDFLINFLFFTFRKSCQLYLKSRGCKWWSPIHSHGEPNGENY